jgi:hypothetical protein
VSMAWNASRCAGCGMSPVHESHGSHDQLGMPIDSSHEKLGFLVSGDQLWGDGGSMWIQKMSTINQPGLRLWNDPHPVGAFCIRKFINRELDQIGSALLWYYCLLYVAIVNCMLYMHIGEHEQLPMFLQWQA